MRIEKDGLVIEVTIGADLVILNIDGPGLSGITLTTGNLFARQLRDLLTRAIVLAEYAAQESP